MPDEELLALWVEDELDGSSAAAVEAWAASQPEWLERREQARQLKPLLQAALPGREDPPYAEFFNARIGREIAREAAALGPASPGETPSSGFWKWFLPATAVAGMALCFWGGTRFGPTVAADNATATIPAEQMPIVYTPEKGVNAAYFASAPADAMVIVLDGVAAIPDSFEIPETAAVEEPMDSTASLILPAP